MQVYKGNPLPLFRTTLKGPPSFRVSFFLFFLNLFLQRGEGRRDDVSLRVWLPLALPLLGTWFATQACALTGTRTSDPLVPRPVLSPLSHTSQGQSLLSSQLRPLLQLHHSSASLSSPLFEFVPSQVLLFLRFPSKLLGCKGPPQSLFLREFDLKFEVSVYLLYNLHCARCLNFTVINRKQVIINCDKYYNLSLIHISEPTRRKETSRMPSSA